MKLYKLTDEDGQSRGGMQWGAGITNTAREGVPKLCTDTVLHAYTDPLLAVMLAPLHVCWVRPRLWEADGDVVVRENDLKVGCKSLTTTAEMPLPAVTPEQRVKFAILCALKVYDDPAFAAWANSWASGEDRSPEAAPLGRTPAAFAAAWAARAAEVAESPTWAAAMAAAWAVEAAAKASRSLDLAALARRACS